MIRSVANSSSFHPAPDRADRVRRVRERRQQRGRVRRAGGAVRRVHDAANFRQLVLGCMDSYDSDQRLILQGFSRSTRFTNLRTAPISKMQEIFVRQFRIFAVLLSKFQRRFANFFVKKSPILMKIFRYFSNFHGEDQNLLDSQIS